MLNLGKKNVLGIMVSALDYEAAVERVMTAATLSLPLAVTALAVHGVMTGVTDLEHQYRLNSFDLIVPDGQPVRWALNLLYGSKLQDRVYGPNLMLKVCKAAATKNLPVYFYGSSANVVQKLSMRLSERFPDLLIAGAEPSKFGRLSADEHEQLVERIARSGAAIVFVGLGCPRQEVFTFELRSALALPILAVGAAFAFHAGSLPQAPRWMQDRGLEWLYRLGREPSRLWKRYVFLNPLFVGFIALQMLGRRFDTGGRKPHTQQLYG
jgi:exopolysaccharide biosynthesis WecB/TagA/CpsF family protein